jgi:hypothetical protein
LSVGAPRLHAGQEASRKALTTDLRTMNPQYTRYDVSDMEPSHLTRLAGLLEQRHVPHAIDRGVLLVFATDERRVDAALDEVERATSALR